MAMENLEFSWCVMGEKGFERGGIVGFELEGDEGRWELNVINKGNGKPIWWGRWSQNNQLNGLKWPGCPIGAIQTSKHYFLYFIGLSELPFLREHPFFEKNWKLCSFGPVINGKLVGQMGTGLEPAPSI